MAWVKLDDTFVEHPKVLAAGPLAAWLHVCAISYCNRNLTDGLVPKAVASRLADVSGPAKHIASLVREGLWIEQDHEYLLHDYLEYQPSRAQVEAEREAAKKRMASSRAKVVGS